MGESTNKNRFLVAAALLVLAGGAFYCFDFRGTARANTRAFFVDEETGEEFIRPLNDVPPLVGKSGKETVVREVKYSDDGGKTSKIAYYYKFTPEMKKRLEAAVAAGKNISDIDTNSSELVCSPAVGSKWVPLGSNDGQRISQISIPTGKERSFMIIIP